MISLSAKAGPPLVGDYQLDGACEDEILRGQKENQKADFIGSGVERATVAEHTICQHP